MIEHIKGKTIHVRRGTLANAFAYGVDYVLLDLATQKSPAVFSRNGFNLWAVWDRNHGGAPREGKGAEWFKDVLRAQGFPPEQLDLRLLTQPSFFGYTFNPVSFWFAFEDGALVAFIAEVNNTFGHRHCYFCAHDDHRPIAKSDRMHAEKLMHVSPFQKVEGDYYFNVDLTTARINILINYRNGEQGVFANLTGDRQRATSLSLSAAAIRRPMGALRVLALIHWQAIKLWLKKAPFMKKPPAPDALLSEGSGHSNTRTPTK